MCFEGVQRLMRRRNPYKGLKLIGDVLLSDAEVPLQPGGPRSHGTTPGNQRPPSPLDGRWKNPNLRWLRYLIKQDLDNIAWWYWLDDGDDDDIPLLPIQNPHIYIWEAGCRLYEPDTKENIHYYSTKCRICHEFDLWMRSFGRPAVEYAVSRMNIGM
jgi:hypothetical protein